LINLSSIVNFGLRALVKEAALIILNVKDRKKSLKIILRKLVWNSNKANLTIQQ